jgi:DNA-binding MarR family transcriptional regulator
MALDREGELIQARIASGLGIAPPTLSIMLRKLLDQGLVKRSADKEDVRAFRIALTPVGRAAVKRVEQVWGEAYETIVNSLQGDDAEFVRTRLLKIRNALGGTSPELQ